MREGYAELGTVRLHYVEQGEGPLVVLLHGFPEFWYGWRHQIGPLAEAGFRVVAPDMRGYNLSSKPRGRDQYDVATLAQDVAELIEERGATRAHVAGHDWGGAVAWATAGFHPEAVRAAGDPQRAAPAACSSSTSRTRASSRAPGTWASSSSPTSRSCSAEAGLRPASRRRARPLRGGLRPAGRADRDAQLLPRAVRDTPRSAERRIRTVHAPTRVIWGTRDRYLGPALAEPHRADVPNLERVIRLDTSHWVQHEAPEEVAALLVEFFSLT